MRVQNSLNADDINRNMASAKINGYWYHFVYYHDMTNYQAKINSSTIKQYLKVQKWKNSSALDVAMFQSMEVIGA